MFSFRSMAFIYLAIVFMSAEHKAVAFTHPLPSSLVRMRQHQSQPTPLPSSRSAALSVNVPSDLGISFSRHVLLWTATTVGFRYMLPPLQRLLLPKSSQAYQNLDTFLTEHHHEQFEALSPLCWAVHVTGQALLSLTALLVLLPASNSAAIRTLGYITLFNAAGGGLLLGSHGLIHRHPMLEKLLDFSGTRVVRAATFATGPALMWPSAAVPVTALIFLLSAMGKVTFGNALGRILGMFGIAVQLFTTGLSVPYKIATAAMLFVIPFLPESQYDQGHTIVAGTISIPYLVLLFSH